MRYYREQKQALVLAERARQREGKVCANTINVGRLAPKGGVTYDETKRHTRRIKEIERYKMRRWPWYDKCGRVLVDELYHAWGIT